MPKKLGTLYRMANWSQSATEALSTAVNRRRAYLGVSQLEVWKRGGPSNSTMTSIEGAVATSITASTLRKIDVGLQWPAGTALKILKGQVNPTGAAEIPAKQSPTDRARALEVTTRDEVSDFEEGIIADAWSETHDLVSAINSLESPTEELRDVARRIIFTLSAYLITRILTSPQAPQLEAWLNRIYIEREQLYRAVTDGAPHYPWYGPGPSESVKYKEGRYVVETTPQPSASSEGDEDEKTELPHEPKAGLADVDVLFQTTGIDGGTDDAVDGGK